MARTIRKVTARDLEPEMMARTAAYLPFVQITSAAPHRLMGLDSIYLTFQGVNREGEPYSNFAYVSPGTVFEVTP
jgi:hypothetical protein